MTKEEIAKIKSDAEENSLKPRWYDSAILKLIYHIESLTTGNAKLKAENEGLKKDYQETHNKLLEMVDDNANLKVENEELRKKAREFAVCILGKIIYRESAIYEKAQQFLNESKENT
jgi:regulator of replication initiation timing